MYIISERWSSKISEIRITARFQFFMHMKKDGKVLTYIAYMVNFFVFLLNITIVTDSLLKLFKVLHQNMQKTISSVLRL